MNHLVRAIVGAALSLTACGGDPILGKNGCYGAKTVCESDAPTYGVTAYLGDVYPPLESVPVEPGAGALGSLGNLSGNAFPIEATSSLPPTWVFDCPMERCRYGQFTQLAPAPGGVWMATFNGGILLMHMGADGNELASFQSALNVGSYQLSVDEQLQPGIGYFSRGTQTAGWLHLAQGAQGFEESLLHDLPLTEPGPRFFLSGPQGTLRVHAIAGERTGVYAYDDSGTLLWKQGNVRDLPVSDYEDDLPDLSPWRAVVLASGNTALLVPKMRDRSYAEQEPIQVAGVTLLNPDGNLLWDAVSMEGTKTYKMALGNAGTFVLAYTMDSTGDLSVVKIGEDATLRGSWNGQRQGYQGVTPRALTVDAAGSIYVALYTGERGAAVPTICQLPPDTTDAPHCVALETSSPEFPASGIVDMVSPEPNAVVVVMDRSDQDPHPLALMRFDF